jgi:uncharacterized membrane protein YccC
MSIGAVIFALLVVVVIMLVRSREVALWQVLVIALFGFYLARSSLAGPIGSAVVWLVTGLTHSN